MINSSKVIRKQTITTATLEDAWKAWTTAEGVTSFFVPKANIEPVVGGRYELFSSLKAPKGFQGTEGCKVLGLEPLRRLAFEFIAPPQFPNVRRLLTRVDVMIDQVVKGGVVKVDLAHSGFLEGEEWDEFFEFSNWNWDLVLGRFQYRFSVGPIDWNNPYIPRGISARPERKLRDHISAQAEPAATGDAALDATFIATGLGSPHSTRFMSEEGFMPGATTVGLVCKDGAILASERRYSYGTFVMSKVAKKVFKITDNIGVGCAGIIGDMQVLAREANAYMSIYRYERGRPGTVKNTAKLFASILSSRRLFPYLAQTIIAGIDDGVPELFVLDPIGSVLGDKFAAVGTGAEIAMGVLEAEYRDGLSVEEARPLILRAIKSAVARDISSGDGVDLLIITHDGIKEESQKFA